MSARVVAGAVVVVAIEAAAAVPTCQGATNNIRIEFTDDRDDVYLSYKLNPFKANPE